MRDGGMQRQRGCECGMGCIHQLLLCEVASSSDATWPAAPFAFDVYNIYMLGTKKLPHLPPFAHKPGRELKMIYGSSARCFGTFSTLSNGLITPIFPSTIPLTPPGSAPPSSAPPSSPTSTTTGPSTDTS